ncbi:D-2-hydroxyacid dehydrogenase [Aestuariibacter salexigens]|uniref:D-2-hydroxyacid dehydrogenase n=1 Tax=Aestuariibacter salexigens TaxID=226010 RepID=UPI000417FA4D|nr:D-2-hydroxyacid dehydrogenase [Aestuariibacter salexigens]
MKAAILDLDTLHPDDLDLSAMHTLPVTWQCFDATSPEQTMQRLKDVDVVLSNKVRIDRQHFEQHPRLRYVGVLATGTNNIDLQAARDHGVVVNNVNAYGTPSVVQHTLMLMLLLAGNYKAYQQDIAEGGWSASSSFCLMQHPMTELAGKHLVILGYGELGQGVASAAKALGMKVTVAASLRDDADDDRLPLDVLLPEADFVSVHCLLSEKTERLFNAERFSLMKTGCFFINTARGGLVDESALLEALQCGHLGGAGLDVLSEEPPPEGHPLLSASLPNLIITPHNAWATKQARQRLFDQALAKLRDHLPTLKSI